MMKLPEGAQAQEKFQQTMRSCLDCHQLGNKATRELSAASKDGTKTTLEAWDKRTKYGPSGAGMGADFQGLGEARQGVRRVDRPHHERRAARRPRRRGRKASSATSC